MSLEEILKMLGSKHPLRENPIKEVIDGDEHMNYLTISGWKAYDRLTSLILLLIHYVQEQSILILLLMSSIIL